MRKLTQRAGELLRDAGRPATGTTLDRVSSTLRSAALAEPGRTLLRDGRLTSDVEVSGFDAFAGLEAPASGRRAARDAGDDLADRRRQKREAERKRRALEKRVRELSGRAEAAERDAARTRKDPMRRKPSLVRAARRQKLPRRSLRSSTASHAGSAAIGSAEEQRQQKRHSQPGVDAQHSLPFRRTRSGISRRTTRENHWLRCRKPTRDRPSGPLRDPGLPTHDVGRIPRCVPPLDPCPTSTCISGSTVKSSSLAPPAASAPGFGCRAVIHSCA